MKKENWKMRIKRWWYRLLDGVNSSKVKGHESVKTTLDKLNRK